MNPVSAMPIASSDLTILLADPKRLGGGGWATPSPDELGRFLDALADNVIRHVVSQAPLPNLDGKSSLHQALAAWLLLTTTTEDFSYAAIMSKACPWLVERVQEWGRQWADPTRETQFTFDYGEVVILIAAAFVIERSKMGVPYRLAQEVGQLVQAYRTAWMHDAFGGSAGTPPPHTPQAVLYRRLLRLHAASLAFRVVDDATWRASYGERMP